MERKTPLYDKHLKYAGKITAFAGYLLPVQYAGIIAEHMAVRSNAGLFDVSHMGEITLCGKDALSNLQNLLTNDFSDMSDGRVRYSPMCNDNGGIVDDLLVYRVSYDKYFIIVNAANREKDVKWIKKRIFGEVEFEDVSEKYAQLALQGPRSHDILKKLTSENNIPLKYYHFKNNVDIAGVSCLLSRTGYTGEDGFELYCAPDRAGTLMESLLDAGKNHSLMLCGLGARDTLRLEAGMPLYGHEMDDEISPLETSLAFFVKQNKPDFIGKKALSQRGTPEITRVGLNITGRGIAREGCDVYSGDEKIGQVTSGTFSPFFQRPIAMALLPLKFASPGTKLKVDIRGRYVEAETTGLPFYKRAR